MLLADQLDEEAKRVIDDFGPKICATNVAEYYYSHAKERWRLADFPMPHPPFDSLWCEYRIPKEVRSKEVGVTQIPAYAQGFTPYFGCLISKTKEFLPDPIKGRSGPIPQTHITDLKPPTPGQWGVWGGVWLIDHADRRPAQFTNEIYVRFDLTEDLSEIKCVYFPNSMASKAIDEKAGLLYFLPPVLMAFSFSNCKNIEVVDVLAPGKLQKARERRGKRPLYSYRIINVLPFGKSYRRVERSVESGGEGVALRIRRGSYAKYGEKFNRGKLFSKYEGMFWRPQTTYGSAEHGVSVHDYDVRAKA
jgi:hypothetical protein